MSMTDELTNWSWERVAAHGGTIAVTSSTNSGTCFRIELPENNGGTA